MSERVNVLAEEIFDSTVLSDGVVLVDFWADWCAPCHAMHPILDEIAWDFDGQVSVAKIDVNEYKAIADRFEITTLPTMIFFKDGEPVRRMSGVKRKPQLERELHELLS